MLAPELKFRFFFPYFIPVSWWRFLYSGKRGTVLGEVDKMGSLYPFTAETSTGHRIIHHFSCRNKVTRERLGD